MKTGGTGPVSYAVIAILAAGAFGAGFGLMSRPAPLAVQPAQPVAAMPRTPATAADTPGRVQATPPGLEPLAPEPLPSRLLPSETGSLSVAGLTLDDEDTLDRLAIEIEQNPDRLDAYLLRLEGARDEDERQILRDIMFRMDDPAKLDLIDGLHRSANIENRRDGVELLGTLSELPPGSERIVEAMLMSETDPKILPRLFSTAENFDAPGLSAMLEPTLRHHLSNSGSPDVRRSALFTLTRIRPVDAQTADLVFPGLASDDTDRVSDSLYAVSLALDKISDQPDHAFRQSAGQELRRMAEDQSVPADDRIEALAILSTHYGE